MAIEDGATRALTAQREIAEVTLADALHDQAIQFLAWSRELQKKRPFSAGTVRAQLQEMFGLDTDLCGQLQALTYLEHPGSTTLPAGARIVRSIRNDA